MDLQAQLLVEFRRVSRERLQTITLGWIGIERDPSDHAQFDAILRELHTLKGESKVLGIGQAAELAHAIEELVLSIRESGSAPGELAGEAVLRAVDVLQSLCDAEDAGNQAREVLASIAEALSAHAVVEPVAPPAHTPESELTASAASARASDRAYLRVDADSVDEFAKLAGDLVVQHARYDHGVTSLQSLCAKLWKNLSRSLASTRLDLDTRSAASLADSANLQELKTDMAELLESLEREVHEGSKAVRQLEYGVRRLRLVPLAGMFERYVRPVRDLAREHGKKARLEIHDRGAVLDKRIIERLSDSFLHLVRNSVDHGLETPDERRALGKHEEGTLRLLASEERGIVTLSVADDGRGLDVEAIKSRGIDLGLFDEANSSQLSEEEIYGLMFQPGFSTRKVVTETSGRGIGLDVVARNVQRLGGKISVRSELGAGSRFDLSVPLTVSLSRSVVAEASGDVVGVPVSAVRGILLVEEEDIVVAAEREMVSYQGALIPLFDLAQVLGAPNPEPKRRALVVDGDGTLAAFLVSSFRGEVDVVMRPMGRLLDSLSLVTGAGVLQDATMALFLDPAELVARSTGEGRRVKVVREGASEAVIRRRSIMLVEDSAITRVMLARLLRNMDYEVHEAVDGKMALEMLNDTSVDLVLTDVDMPRMNGIDLILAIRAKAELSALPIVVLSTRGSDEDKSKASSAGADGYLVKTDFSEEMLYEAISLRLQ